ncbi:hypothetical protein [Fuerstiella marisgermanici]|uniref:hypothetical protein n=1 Tax=Fuerstiella marisgermanici TaxID=1891926 RepID=UPI00097BC331|nr:hypothetical protein [Fuerstiella marisgermanici]
MLTSKSGPHVRQRAARLAMQILLRRSDEVGPTATTFGRCVPAIPLSFPFPTATGTIQPTQQLLKEWSADRSRIV